MVSDLSLTISIIVAAVDGVILPWLIAIERRLSRIEGFLMKRCNGYVDCCGREEA